MQQVSRLVVKKNKSAEKARKKWEEAKKRGKHVEQYVPSEEDKKPRLVVPVIVTLANYFIARQEQSGG